MPVLAGAVTMMLMDIHFGTSFFNAAGTECGLLFNNAGVMALAEPPAPKIRIFNPFNSIFFLKKSFINPLPSNRLVVTFSPLL